MHVVASKNCSFKDTKKTVFECQAVVICMKSVHLMTKKYNRNSPALLTQMMSHGSIKPTPYPGPESGWVCLIGSGPAVLPRVLGFCVSMSNI